MTTFPSYSIEDIEPLVITLRNFMGIVVPEGYSRNLIERIEPLLSNYHLDSFSSLADKIRLHGSDETKSAILDAISQVPSDWALNEDIRSILQNYVFEQLPPRARVWLEGCKLGQSAYALAMDMLKYEFDTDENKNIHIHATDVSGQYVDFAGLATYSQYQLSGLNEENIKAYVVLDGNGEYGQLKEKVRRLISFSRCDLTRDFEDIGDMDLIICPDDLGYFTYETKNNILRRLAARLKPGGIFLTDSSQIIMSSATDLERVEHPAGIFYRKIH